MTTPEEQRTNQSNLQNMTDHDRPTLTELYTDFTSYRGRVSSGVLSIMAYGLGFVARYRADESETYRETTQPHGRR